MGKLLLIDGHSILNRAYYGVRGLSTSKGVPTNAVYGFLNMMFKYIEEEKPDYMVVAFDESAPTFRHEMYREYKGTRKPMDEELRVQVPMMKKMLVAMGIHIVSCPGLEADDILGTLSRMGASKGMEVTILSGDRDLLQLATDKVMIAIPKTSKGVTTTYYYHDEDVILEYGCTPTEFIDVKALMGDQSDNIPGVPSIGEKTAKDIISVYKSIENAHAHADEIRPPRASKNIKEYYDQAVLSKELATIKLDADLDIDIDDCNLSNIYTEEAYGLCKEWELKRLLDRFEIKDKKASEITYQVVDTQERLDELFERLSFEEYVGISYVRFGDDEKSGQLELFSSDELKLMALAGDKETVLIGLEREISETYLIGALSDLSNKCKLISYDLKKMLHDYEALDTADIYDVSLMYYLLDSTRKEYDYSYIATEYLGMNLPSRQELIGKQSSASAYAVGKDNLIRVIVNEAYVACKGYAKGVTLLDEDEKKLYYDIEMPLVSTLYHMEREGISLDSDILRQYGVKLKEETDKLTSDIYDLAGEEFNINSPKQLGEILFSEDKLALKGSKKTKSGYSTSADILEKLAPEHEIVGKILKYRALTKLYSTYIDGLISEVDRDGKIHCTFRQTVTATGRLSCTDPNLQNIPIRTDEGREIRRAFYPRDGYVFVDADYSQVELRVLAHMSGDMGLIDAFNRGDDIHTSTASKIFMVDASEVTSLQRRAAKAVNFGIVYGESAHGLSENLGITRAQAKKYIDDYFEAYPKMKEFLDGLVKSAARTGYALTLLGRKRYIAELKSNNYNMRSFGERVAMNTPIQGTAADIIKMAMIRVDYRLRSEGLKSKLILQVHDELLVEAARDEQERVYDILREEMMGVIDLSVPLEIDIHSGTTWYEAK